MPYIHAFEYTLLHLCVKLINCSSNNVFVPNQNVFVIFLQKPEIGCISPLNTFKSCLMKQLFMEFIYKGGKQ